MSTIRKNLISAAITALATGLPLGIAVFVVLEGDALLHDYQSRNSYLETAKLVGLATKEGRQEWMRINRLADSDIAWTQKELLLAFTAPDRCPEIDRPYVFLHSIAFAATWAEAEPARQIEEQRRALVKANPNVSGKKIEKMMEGFTTVWPLETKTAIGKLIAEGFASKNSDQQANAALAAMALGWDPKAVYAEMAKDSFAAHVVQERITGNPMAEREGQ